jgi:hypothetical protein
LVLLLAAGCAKDHGAENAQNDAARTKYNNPLSTPGARYGSLPQNIQSTVLSEAGTAEIEDVIKENIEGRVIYKIHFRDNTVFPPLLIGSDGSVLNPDLSVAVPARQIAASTLKLGDVPLSVSKAIQEHAPNAEIASVSKETWGDHAIYIVSFKDEAQHPKLYIVGDGTVLRRM